jgi:hypothetical protein
MWVTNNSFMDFGTYDPLSGVDYWGGGVILLQQQLRIRYQ